MARDAEPPLHFERKSLPVMLPEYVDPPERAGLDFSTPHPARVYDYWLMGKDNFAADREVGDAMIARIPETRQSCLDNRAFLVRAVRDLAQLHDLRQFLDLGSGFPTRPSVHEVVQNTAPTSRVVYVDNDPLVHLHGRSLLVSSPQGAVGYLGADIRDVEHVLDEASQTLDLSRPVAVIMAGILHFLPDEDDLAGIIRRFLDPLPSGSALVLSHMTADGSLHEPDCAHHVVRTWEQSGIGMYLRDRQQVVSYFAGLDLLPPGVMPVHRWRPTWVPDRPRWWLWGGVALRT